MKENLDEHEMAFVHGFITPHRRERYLSKLLSTKHRRKFLGRLNHQLPQDLDSRFIVPGTRPWPMDIKTCHILADEVAYDARRVTTEEAADVIAMATFGIVVSFLPGKLACFKAESPADIVWLERK